MIERCKAQEATGVQSVVHQQLPNRFLSHTKLSDIVFGCSCLLAADRSVSGKYHTVTCLDVMIHYPQEKADAMISHLAGLADERLIVSFAPKTVFYSLLKRVGELFPGPSKVSTYAVRTATCDA
jgi:2-polyprenyl-3-methyl-5-hydroxy-6-metoxy-1,4-benzoquinol methylase